MSAAGTQASPPGQRRGPVLIAAAIILYVANYSFWGWFCQSNACGPLVSLITLGYMLAAFLAGTGFTHLFLTGPGQAKMRLPQFFRGEQRYCMSCGSKIPLRAKFCNQCGLLQQA